MTQSVSNQNANQYGYVSKIGTTTDGRVIYQVTDSNNKQGLKMSVAAQDADTFEKSYKEIIESAPKLQKYAMDNPPEKIEKKRNIAKWLVAGLGIIGGLIPMIKVKGNGVAGTLKQLVLTLLGTATGLGAGIFASSKLLTPPGAKEFAKATNTISKLDIKQIQ